LPFSLVAAPTWNSRSETVAPPIGVPCAFVTRPVTRASACCAPALPAATINAPAIVAEMSRVSFRSIVTVKPRERGTIHFARK
jgi:hypothetical protein